MPEDHFRSAQTSPAPEMGQKSGAAPHGPWAGEVTPFTPNSLSILRPSGLTLG